MSMIQKHCYECGTALTERELESEGIVPYCPQCQQYRFPMYNVAVSMVVINKQTGQILLIRQYGKPHFILVAGYVNPEMLGCSQQIAAQNRMRYMRFFEDAPKLPAILAYHGQAYKHLKAETLNVNDLNYSQGKLWITSFLYGLLRPLDGIQNSPISG